ncbi:peptidase U32 family protein [Jeotgalibacillus proteolyticus]|uniref:Collagenase-like protease n=1 Tax=Jeotgalibacillus proteolyticus TaxID=2082395 RepID=A0A2S5GF04_9BACL|nr:peptidase U32 family protein [Jeotgalibacillus proteolyticus]PPA71494.1 collagenase-like protease [Jeotgalibacillus proteolyticus]
MNKPELLVTPLSVQHVKKLCEAGADAFMIGEQRYGLRMASEFSKEQCQQAITIAHEYGKKVYIAVNGIFHNDKVDELNDYLLFCEQAGADAIVFGDPAVLMAARESTPHLPLHWNTETTATNYYTCNYWGKKGAKRAVLARELSMDAIIEMKENAEVEIEVQVHGMTCMFQSKRSLLGNYFLYQGKALEIENRKEQKNMLLHDPERSNKYPIFEDENGTHIMSPNDMCIIDELAEMIEAGVDSFKIEGILQSSEYVTAVTALYRKAIDACIEDPEAYEEIKDQWLEEIEALQQPHRPLDTGFFFKETVY